MDVEVKTSKHRKWLHIPLAIIILGLLAWLGWSYFSQYDQFNRQNLEAFIRGFGPWAPVIYVVLYIASSPIPLLAPVLSATGGLLFGTFWGMVMVLFVATLSSFVPFIMARQLGRDWVESKLEGKKLEDIFERSAGKEGFTFIVLLRLIPLFPWEVQNYIAGLTKVSPPIFAAGTILGIIPGSFSLVFLGASATDPTSWQFFVAVGLKVLVGAIPVIYLFVKNRLEKRQAAA
jgi:uncharacterized membrane protein YdjX (TVP38/TMEM64 family)